MAPDFFRSSLFYLIVLRAILVTHFLLTLILVFCLVTFVAGVTVILYLPFYLFSLFIFLFSFPLRDLAFLQRKLRHNCGKLEEQQSESVYSCGVSMPLIR